MCQNITLKCIDKEPKLKICSLFVMKYKVFVTIKYPP